MPDQAIRQDVRGAFLVAELRTFRLENGRTYAIVGHNEDLGFITDIWYGGFESRDRFRDVLEFICDRFDTGCYHLWLADLRHMSRGFQDSEDWLAEYVFPRVIAGGLAREAVVLPKQVEDLPPDFDVFGSASAALKKITDGRVRGFDDLGQARAWLLDGNRP
jgi:hypothetical protein